MSLTLMLAFVLLSLFCVSSLSLHVQASDPELRHKLEAGNYKPIHMTCQHDTDCPDWRGGFGVCIGEGGGMELFDSKICWFKSEAGKIEDKTWRESYNHRDGIYQTHTSTISTTTSEASQQQNQILEGNQLMLTETEERFNSSIAEFNSTQILDSTPIFNETTLILNATVTNSSVSNNHSEEFDSSNVRLLPFENELLIDQPPVKDIKLTTDEMDEADVDSVRMQQDEAELQHSQLQRVKQHRDETDFQSHSASQHKRHHTLSFTAQQQVHELEQMLEHNQHLINRLATCLSTASPAIDAAFHKHEVLRATRLTGELNMNWLKTVKHQVELIEQRLLDWIEYFCSV